jgi:parallel beta-helix repeat protein
MMPRPNRSATMTLEEARAILGLKPDEDPRARLDGFEKTRAGLAAMAGAAADGRHALRRRQKLEMYERALAVLRGHMEDPRDAGAAGHAGAGAWLAAVLVLLALAAVGVVLYQKHDKENQLRIRQRITVLEQQGAAHLENRRWLDAAGIYQEIRRLDPQSAVAAAGMRGVEAGMVEEQNQFVGYWTGQAIAGLEAGQLDEAEAAVRRVLERYPDESEAAAILGRVAAAREGLARAAELAAARGLLEKREWQAAVDAARRMLRSAPGDRDAAALLADASAALEKHRADQARALELHRMAAARDQGVFDQAALDMLREAMSLAPELAVIRELHEKMASYTRTLRVPEDFATPAEALAAARGSDRIVLASGTWQGPLVIDAAVDFQGAGPGLTVVECAPGDGSAITIGPGAQGARVSGMNIRHASFLADGNKRFAAALVRGGGAIFVDCHFSDASGHGLVVIERGEAVARRCRFIGNAWNGAAATGGGARLEVRDSVASGNFEHGIESWDGAAATLVNNRCEGNSRNGIHADSHAAAVVIEGNRLVSNREFGLVLGSAGAGSVTGNSARDNQLGGFVFRTRAAAAAVSGNHATANHGPGIVFEAGFPAADDPRGNMASGNDSGEVITDADLSPGP